MAINIFQGAVSRGKKAVNSAAQSTRAQQAKAALSAPSEVSASGNTAVSTKGTLGKVGDFVGKTANVVSKFLPGVGGTIAKGIANLFNDPEWWQAVPGEAVSCNLPLRPVALNNNTIKFRGAIAEFVSSDVSPVVPSTDNTARFDASRMFYPTEQMITQYLMPEIRKVVNAIPLQSAEAYRQVLVVHAELYAIWRQLLKFDYMLKHGQTYLANMNDTAFPLFQVENAAFLQSTINRIEEYLRANVRIPHTLCEYLAWRYGRVYRTMDSARAGVVLYNVFSMTMPIDKIAEWVAALMATPTSSVALQQANTDLYNAYYDHDLMVVIADDTQFCYDKKEFLLRTNCDVRPLSATNQPGASYRDEESPNIVYIDSGLDVPTTYMASTISTIGKDMTGGVSVLFPITRLFVYFPAEREWLLMLNNEATDDEASRPRVTTQVREESKWYYVPVSSQLAIGQGNNSSNWLSAIPNAKVLMALLACKCMDIYNKDLTIGMVTDGGTPSGVDFTSISMDAGFVPDTTLGAEHVYAFANLVHIDRKSSMSYKQGEKLVAREAATLIDKMDVATVQS